METEQKNEGLSALQESVHFSQGDKTCRSVNNIKLTLIMSLIVAMTYTGTTIHSRYYGSYWQNGVAVVDLVAELGKLKELHAADVKIHKSDVAIHQQLKRFSDENNRLSIELKNARNKLGFKNETIFVYRGITKNNPQWLELSKSENKNRDEKFEFIQWDKPNELVDFMIISEAWDCLEWVISQPKWDSYLDEKTLSKMIKFNEDLNDENLKKAAHLLNDISRN
jgi:hypothetical protein